MVIARIPEHRGSGGEADKNYFAWFLVSFGIFHERLPDQGSSHFPSFFGLFPLDRCADALGIPSTFFHQKSLQQKAMEDR